MRAQSGIERRVTGRRRYRDISVMIRHGSGAGQTGAHIRRHVGRAGHCRSWTFSRYHDVGHIDDTRGLDEAREHASASQRAGAPE